MKITKKNKKIKMKNEPDSVNLFDFGVSCPVVTHDQRVERLRKKKAEGLEPSEHRRSSDSSQKPRTVEFSLEKSSVKDDGGREGGKADKTGDNSGHKETSRRITDRIEIDSPNRRVERDDKKKERRSEKLRGGNRKVDEPIQGDGDEGKLSQEIDLMSYPLSEFPVSDKIIPPRKIDAGPVKADNLWNVYILLSGKRYKVSSWSIKGGVYIQGLDSNYLVFKYRI